MESQSAWEGTPGLPRRRELDLAELATFTVGPGGLVAAWSPTAAKMFGYPARDMAGHDICDVLMTGPGQRELVRRALGETGEGRVFNVTVAGGNLGEGRFAMRWEPLTGPGGVALVIVEQVSPLPRPAWLSEATARIGSTLDLFQTASEAVDAAVPWFSDAAVIYVAERLLAAGEFAPARASHGIVVRRLAGRLVGGPGDALAGTQMPPGEVLVFGEGTPSSRAMVGGEPVLFSAADEEPTQRLGRHARGSEVATNFSSYLAVPLTARGVVVGCAVFARAPASPTFNPTDVTLASELASRTAVFLDNARLYQRERRTALALQRSLLPSRPQVPGGMEVAHRYLPVGASVVGGDWYDIVSLNSGRAALIVGDAMGHGPEAAAVMAQLRTAAHTLADLGLSPGQLLPRLDRIVAGMAAATFATCISTVIDPAAGSCVAAQAGHLPPVLVMPDGETCVLELAPGLPLGLGAESFEATEIKLPPGATLALYTDGLVESRTRSVDDGLAALREALSTALTRPSGTLAGACEMVTQALREHGEDDITLVLARTHS
ncbi:MAG TPA: SpoIIE family protein phosphatase [Streptosporangiaceae bacterium]|nr:SpoIIE family protein phosphatase [Streptosporangiaceae bacterium]